jgi:hypothetical protein
LNADRRRGVRAGPGFLRQVRADSEKGATKFPVVDLAGSSESAGRLLRSGMSRRVNHKQVD